MASPAPIPQRIEFYLASAGSSCLTEIAQLYQEGFQRLAKDACLLFDQIPKTMVDPETMQIIVGPHEFFDLFLNQVLPEPSRHRIAQATYFLTTERPGSHWFELSWDQAVYARWVFDISALGALEFRRRRVNATHTPLGYAASLERPAAPGEVVKDIDVTVLATSTPRREILISRYAPVLQRHNCRLILIRPESPRSSPNPHCFFGAKRAHLLGRSKILLNVHWSDQPYFEWHRALCALANRCLIVSEPSEGHEPLEDGKHLVLARYHELADRCEYYLANESARADIVERAYGFLRTDLGVTKGCQAMLEVARLEGALTCTDASLRTAATAFEAKRQAHIEYLEFIAKNGPGGGAGCYRRLENSAYVQVSNPSVSIIITLYNYAKVIEECLTSVSNASLSGIPGGVEVLVIDDASTDSSGEVVTRFMERSHLPMCLIIKDCNTGVSDTLNLGVQMARARYLFMLDADNWIYPTCLSKLYGALVNSKAAAAYGIIQMFDDVTGEPMGLISQYPWDVRALVRDPDMDSMALLDRECVVAVGGFSTDLVKYGWWGHEDYDLWLKFAQNGFVCKLVPEIVAAYRVHQSALTISLVRSGYRPGIIAHFYEKFANLVDSCGPLDYAFGVPLDYCRSVLTEAGEPVDSSPSRATQAGEPVETSSVNQPVDVAADPAAEEIWTVGSGLKPLGPEGTEEYTPRLRKLPSYLRRHGLRKTLVVCCRSAVIISREWGCRLRRLPSFFREYGFRRTLARVRQEVRRRL